MCTRRRLKSALALAQSDQSSLYAQWVAKVPNFLHVKNDDSDQTGWMPRLIWVFAGPTCHLFGFVMHRLIFSILYLWAKHLSRNVRKQTFRRVRRTKTQISLCVRAGWSEYLHSGARNFVLLAILNAPNEALRKHAYSNTPKILPPKTVRFQIKKIWYFSHFCSKHRLWVLVRTTSARRF